MERRYFAVGTALYSEIAPEMARIARSIAWLLRERNEDGTWGGPDGLDRFITTNHVAMTLLSVGFSPDSHALADALRFLASIDSDQQVSFFWRSGPLLNLPPYRSLVEADMEYLWAYRRRIGAHRDYPVPFFLLKLLRFINPKPTLTFSTRDVLKWILEEWDDRECWYGRTSITSMALALIYDLQFRNKAAIISRAETFLKEQFTDNKDGTGEFDENFVDDCFTVYNLCERDYLKAGDHAELRQQLSKVATRILRASKDQPYWHSPPPFGGTVGERIYPTAVAVRALLSFYALDRPFLMNEVAASLLDVELANYEELKREFTTAEPFWGEAKLSRGKDFCFVLMPFSPPKLTQIYKRYIKQTIESRAHLLCVRADDIYKPTQIMRDIWLQINQARVIIADLTFKNANVFYELGLAHALGKTVILIAQSIDDIPFDLRSVRTIIYSDSPDGYEELADQLMKYLAELRLV